LNLFYARRVPFLTCHDLFCKYQLVSKVRCSGTNSRKELCRIFIYPSDRYCDFHRDQDTGFLPTNVKDPQCIEETQETRVQCIGHITVRKRLGRQCENWVSPADLYCIHHRDQDPRSRVSSKVEGPQRQTTHTFCPVKLVFYGSPDTVLTFSTCSLQNHRILIPLIFPNAPAYPGPAVCGTPSFPLHTNHQRMTTCR